MSRSMPLSQLLEGIVALPPGRDAAIAGLSLDSRAVPRGGAFVALPGARTHGLHHADAALAAGAAAILFEPPVPDALRVPAAAIAVPRLRARLGAIADRFFGTPSAALTVIGVTGTNGKTSTVQLLAQALEHGGHRAGTIGTLGAGLHGAIRSGERTTPDVISVHALLASLRDDGAGHVAMEVSSHALDQGRVDAVRFDVAVFTNLSHEHLDYHGTMEAYGAAKARLFDWPGLAAAVVNLDDAFGGRIAAQLRTDLSLVGFSARGAAATVRAVDIVAEPEGLAFGLAIGGETASVRSRLLGRFNVENLLAVAGVLHALDRPLPEIAGILAALEPVPGRMNRLGGGERPLVVIDYAHTPDALEQALGALREHVAGRLFCVFGCGGERDRGKRPQMAAIAERIADRVIVTDDNPRSEDGDAIVAGILAGFRDPDAVRVERDRAAAIASAIDGAGADDIVLVAGKGHEAWQERDGRRVPFDDAAVARARLEATA